MNSRADTGGKGFAAVDRPGHVVLLGGYGAVGRAVAEVLVGNGRRVVIAGRDRDKARAAAAALGDLARGVALDAGDPVGIERLVDGASALVMCVERNNARIAELCLERGVSFVDVTATHRVVTSIEALDEAARWTGSTALLSVGLAPGVTNVLARLVHSARPTPATIDLTLYFGLGGDHGADSRRWILDGLASARANGRSKVVTLHGIGRRRAHPFPFSDQHTLTRELGVPVTTRMCFESRFATAALFALRRLRIPALARALGAGPLLERGMGAAHVGSDRFVVQASTEGGATSVVHAAAGASECRATGRVAAAATELVLSGKVAAGVHHLDEVVGLEFLQRLSDVLELHPSAHQGIDDDCGDRVMRARRPSRPRGRRAARDRSRGACG